MADRFQDDGDVAVATKPKTKRPKQYKVLLHNDDYTPMDFVIAVLQEIFHKSSEEATHLMLKVHIKGAAACGTYPFAVAESKVDKVMTFARSEGHPLKCTMEQV